jgi:holin-like protein
VDCTGAVVILVPGHDTLPRRAPTTMRFINGLCLLLVYQLAGELVTLYFDLAVPGPVIGMLMLLATMVVLRRVPSDMDDAAGVLLSHLSLLFVPAGVGVMVHFELIGAEWLPLLVALLASTVGGMALAALTMQAVARWTTRRGGGT